MSFNTSLINHWHLKFTATPAVAAEFQLLERNLRLFGKKLGTPIDGLGYCLFQSALKQVQRLFGELSMQSHDVLRQAAVDRLQKSSVFKVQ